MDLYYEARGQGREIVLVHGWGFHGGVWRGMSEQLGRGWRTIVPDLPGHGRSRWDPALDRVCPQMLLDTTTETIARLVSNCAIWVGWSLGGMLALTAAVRIPHAVERLVLINTTPKFVQGLDWVCALAPEVLDQFGADVAGDYKATLGRFLALQFGPSAIERAALRRARANLFDYGVPDFAGLRAALEILRHGDLRSLLPRLQRPTLVLQGGRDRLVPRQAAEYLAGHIPYARLETIDAAGHAPFLSHPEVVMQQLERFIYA